MSEFDDLLIAGLRVRQAETPDLFFFWNGVAYPCCAGDASFGKQFGLAGFALNADLIVIIIQEDLADKMPKATQTGFYPNEQGTQYRIDRVTRPPGNCFVALALVEKAKGI